MTDNLPVVKSIRMIRKNDTRELIRQLKIDAVEFDCEMYSDAANHIEKLEAALRKISQQDTLWGAICKAKHALGDFDRKALEGKDD